MTLGFFSSFSVACHSSGLACLRGRVRVGLDKRSGKGHEAALSVLYHAFVKTHTMNSTFFLTPEACCMNLNLNAWLSHQTLSLPS